MTNLVNKPLEVVFRQTFNVTWKRWEVPKRRTATEKPGPVAGSVTVGDIWRRIDNVERIITPRDGINMAIWRLQKAMDRFRDTDGQLVWKTSMSKRHRMTIKKITYSVWTLTCTRIKRDLSGA